MKVEKIETWKSNELVHNRLTSSFAKAPADKKDRPNHVEEVHR
jgi:hypothetical protein